jgi:hypothetical protein
MEERLTPNEQIQVRFLFGAPFLNFKDITNKAQVMVKVVYMLWAWASSKSLPTVKEFNDFIGFFLDYLRDNKISSAVCDAINELRKEIVFYPSPDTFARKLFLKREKTRYDQLNNLIALMITWKENVLSLGHNRHRVASSLGIDWFQENPILSKFNFQLDPRYIAFFSALIESPDKLNLPDDLWIISWNYDEQVQYALWLLWSGISDDKYIQLNWVVSLLKWQEYMWSYLDMLPFCSDFFNLKSKIKYAWEDEGGKWPTIRIYFIRYGKNYYNRLLVSCL